jgi:hypothetical protein
MSGKLLRDTLRQMRRYVASNASGELPMWWRLRLWDAMKKHFGDESSLRRSFLALHVCRELLSYWDKADMPTKYRDLPRTVFEMARHMLLGIVSKSTLELLCSDCFRVFEDCITQCGWNEKGDVVFVYLGSRYVVLRVLERDDELYGDDGLYEASLARDVATRPTEEYLGEPEFWDVHFVGSIIAAKGACWERDRCDNELRRQFWVRWLEETLPGFLGDFDAARTKAALV